MIRQWTCIGVGAILLCGTMMGIVYISGTILVNFKLNIVTDCKKSLDGDLHGDYFLHSTGDSV